MQQKILLKVFDLKDAHDLIGTEPKFIKRLRFSKASVLSVNAGYSLFAERGGPQSSCPTWSRKPQIFFACYFDSPSLLYSDIFVVHEKLQILVTTNLVPFLRIFCIKNRLQKTRPVRKEKNRCLFFRWRQSALLGGGDRISVHYSETGFCSCSPYVKLVLPGEAGKWKILVIYLWYGFEEIELFCFKKKDFILVGCKTAYN